MPLAIIIGVLVITAIYLLDNMAYVHVLGFDTLASSQPIAAMVVERMFGPVGSSILAVNGILPRSLAASIVILYLGRQARNMSGNTLC